MSVYVDTAEHAFGRMVMCHMLADTPDELFAMADRIGVARRHFQRHSSPHFDICKTKRALAVRLGAVEIDRQQLVRIIKAHRSNPGPWDEAAASIPIRLDRR